MLLQGVLSPADALLALDHGVDGIVVSNHGGRQLDYSPAALDMLPGEVVECCCGIMACSRHKKAGVFNLSHPTSSEIVRL